MRNYIKDPGPWFWAGTLIFGAVVGALVSIRLQNALPLLGVIGVTFLAVGWWRLHALNEAVRVATNHQEYLEEKRRKNELYKQFALCKPVEELQPEDFGFQPLLAGQESDPHFRPFYLTYVPRRIEPIDETLTPLAGLSYTEVSLRDSLRDGRGFLLLGPPTAGKSRTLYATVKGLEGWLVVSPKKDESTPPSETFGELFTGKQVVLILDDLNDFADATVDLAAFRGSDRLGKAQGWAIAATCRDGAELGAVTEALGRGLRRMYDEIPVKVVLAPQTDQEKQVLALSAGKREWDIKRADAYPTPGTIVMEGALIFVRSRYELLPPVQKDILRAIKLLTAAGILPLNHDRIQTVVEHVFRRQVSHLADHLENLANEAFLHRPGTQDPVSPEFAYVQDSVINYGPVRTLQHDFPALLRALEVSEDAYGVALLGLTYGTVLGNHALALGAFDIALALGPDDPDILVGRGASLLAVGRPSEALADFDAALLHDPENPIIQVNRGAALGELARHEEALATLDASLAIRPDVPEIQANRASVLTILKRHEEALEAIDGSLRMRPDNPGALSVRGGILIQLHRYEEALHDLEMSLRLRPDNLRTIYNRGLGLRLTERFHEALITFDEVISKFNAPFQMRPDRFQVLYHRALTLVSLHRHEEALAGFNAGLELRPGDATTLFGRGVTLCDLHRYEEALADFAAVLNLRPADPKALSAWKYARDMLNARL